MSILVTLVFSSVDDGGEAGGGGIALVGLQLHGHKKCDMFSMRNAMQHLIGK